MLWRSTQMKFFIGKRNKIVLIYRDLNKMVMEYAVNSNFAAKH